MKHYRLIWAGVWRNETRTLFTLFSVLTAFLLFGLLQGVSAAFSGSVQSANLNRLYVESRFGLSVGLPTAALGQMERVAGVSNVAYATWFGGSYQDARQPVFALAVDPLRYFALYPELNVGADAVKRLAAVRTGALVGRKIAQQYGWSVGDKVPLRSSIWTNKANGSSNWNFEIVGIFDPVEGRRTRSDFLFNQAYFDEARVVARGTVGWYVVQIDDPSHAAAIATAIDALFANSANETRTQNEQETAQSLLKQHGDINLIVNLIICAVFFTLIFLTGNTMMQSVRERIPEFAVLKTLGYSSATVAGLIVSEALLICVGAALPGMAAAWLLFPLMQVVTGVARMPALIVVSGLGLAIALAVLSSLPPALRLRTMNTVDALAGR